MRDVSEISSIEDKLRNTQKLLESVIDASNALIYVKDLDGKYVLGNNLWAKNINLPKNEAIGKTDEEIYPKEVASQLQTNDLKVIQSGLVNEFQETISSSEGERIYLSVKFPIFDSYGDIYATAGISTDITPKIQTEQLLQLQSFALEATANAIVITDKKGNIQWVNPAFTHLTGYTLEEVSGRNPRLLKSHHTSPYLFDQLWQTIQDGKVWHGELINRRKDGSEYIEEQTITPLIDQKGEISHFIAIKQDITQRRTSEKALREALENLQAQYAQIQSLQEELREQAIRDSLTGLFNRRYLQETLPRELARANREKKPLSVIMLDIDHFKSVNDLHGHHAGDLLLKAVGEMLRCLTRESDVACRYGGEEFVAVLPGASLEDSCTRAESFREGFEKLSIFYENKRINRTISLGIAAYPEHGVEIETLLAAADRALYQAKEAGRNRIRVSTC
jgi:diguanylate cyclase (GGDEF)-like protein/PAS domain S-box-containing protein